MSFNFLTREPTAHVEIDGQQVPLYPLSARMLLKLKSVGKPIFKAITELLAPVPLAGTTERVHNEGEFYSSENTVSPINPDLWELNSKKLDARVDSIVETLLGEDALDTFAQIIANCMRQESLAPQIRENADISTMIILGKGVVEANREVFAPLKDLLPSDFGSRIKGAVEDRMKGLETDPTPSPTLVEESQPEEATETAESTM